jgi:hypothetical protein
MNTVITTADIKDDVSVVKTALIKTKRQFATGKTKEIAYRIAQLNNLKKGLHELDKDLKDAVTADLGRVGFVTWLAELSII